METASTYKSDLFCEDFGASAPLHGPAVREMPLCGVPAAFGSFDGDGRAGSYISLFTEEEKAPDSLPEAISEAIHLLASPHLKSPPLRVLVSAFGNANVACDSLGCKVADRIAVTGAEAPPRFPEVYAVKTGVPARVGIPSVEIVSMFAQSIDAELVICIDSLAAALPHRMCRVVQLTDAGVAPGSGISAHASALTRERTGVPTLGIGVPTVIRQGSRLLTDARIERLINDLSSSIAGGINRYLSTLAAEGRTE